jgi:cytochrome b561
MKYDRITRWLHACIALAVVNQLLCSQLMDRPRPGRMLTLAERTFFEIHEWSGMTALALLILHWLWGATGHFAGGWGHLFPWFSKNRLRDLGSALKALTAWVKGSIVNPWEATMPLAGAVHGLGLLVATAMAVTGATMFFGMAPDGAMSHFVKDVKEAHEFIASLAWIYLSGHVGMAALHQWLGDRVLTRMFDLVHN